MLTLEEIRKDLRKKCSITAGQDGEEYANNWLTAVGWDFITVEQGIDTLSQKLKEYGGKRPDFIIKHDDKTFIFLDAKYHSTENCTFFTLTDCELGKYRSLKSFFEKEYPNYIFEVIFMVFPKEENGKRFIFVGLDEFVHGECTTLASKDARKVNISITTWSDLWFYNE